MNIREQRSGYCFTNQILSVSIFRIGPAMDQGLDPDPASVAWELGWVG